MKFSLDTAWADMQTIFKGHPEILLIIVGVFSFLPALAWGLAIPPPDLKSDGINNYANLIAWWQTNAPWFALRSLVELVGAATIFAMFLTSEQLTVSSALQRAGASIPILVVTYLCAGMLQVPGFMLLVLPGLYIMSRTLLSTAIVIAEGVTNPVAAIARSFALTAGNGWRITATLIVIFMTGIVISTATEIVIGSVLRVALAPAIAAPIEHTIEAALATLINLAMTLLVVATYRQLSRQLPISISGT